VLPDGRFGLASLMPGRYVIEAQTAQIRDPETRALPPLLWGRAEVEVGGRDLADVTVTLRPAGSVSGTVRFDGSSPAPQDAPLVRLVPERASPDSWIASRPLAAPAAPDGAFVVPGVPPGRYRVIAEPGSAEPASSGWRFAGATVGGHDVADAAFDLGPGEDLEDVAVAFTDRTTTLTGRLLNTSGIPAPSFSVVVFPVDPGRWHWRSRRIALAGLDGDGRFEVRHLPPGDYHLAVLVDILPGEQYDPELLQNLARAAVPVRLVIGEQTRQDIQIAGGP
jgi:hypothetical protein